MAGKHADRDKEIHRRWQEGENTKSLADEYNLNRRTINLIIRSMEVK
jgi:Mor family transcriptional regulator